ncbi:dna repair rad9 [Trichoderma arundinaceum]|uniref:DNA repair protein rad9 n=1 Tax=Trichoderma arundinaceum TaxID=490622 RepID=A0A395NQW1_TRIAR|nr:dna repair rad9 [Trichoderma arundinaceum]
MAILTFTLSEEGVTAFRDALNCLSKFSEDVSIEARKDSFFLSTMNTSKSAYASFRFATNRFFGRYQYQATGQFQEKFYCSMYIRGLASLFRSRSGVESRGDVDKQTIIDRCDVAIEDGEGVKSRFIARIIFRNGLTATHRLPFEVSMPIHAKFNKQEALYHWSISSRTLKQLVDHFGPGTEYLDINTDGDHVNFTCFSEKTISDDAVLKKPLHTSIAVETDEFDDIDVEDKLQIVVSIKDIRAITQHAAITGNAIAARYSLPARPMQFSYASDAISCEFLIMTVGERGGNPAQRTKKVRKGAASSNIINNTAPHLEATSRRTSAAPSQTTAEVQRQQAASPSMPPPTSSRQPPNPTPRLSAAKASASRIGAFDFRPSQRPPPPTLRSESLFVEDEAWEPVRDEDEDGDEDARLEWDHSADPKNPSVSHMSRADDAPASVYEPTEEMQPTAAAESTYLDPTQRLSDVQGLALFPD